MPQVTAVVDAHVHIHPCYAPDEFLDNAYRNLTLAGETAGLAPEASACFLLLTECAQDDCFADLRAQAAGGRNATALRLTRWQIESTQESITLVARQGERKLFIVAGRQVACREGLEVLVLGTGARFRDGLSIRDVLTTSRALGVPRVIPWGPGKWFFRRGRLLRELLREFCHPTLFLGDEGGRPGFWGYPAHFKEGLELGVRDLPGTDPLPFAHDVDKVGRMGFRLYIDLDEERPATSLLLTLIEKSIAPDRFARLESPIRFVRNQIGMQLRKRRRA